MFISIENYLKITRPDKLAFFALISGFKNFKVLHQKVVLNENCLLLDFSEESDVNFAKEVIEKFFEDIEQNNHKIKVHIVKEILQDRNNLVLTFENDTSKRIKL